MKFTGQQNQQKDIFSGLFPQAIANLKKTIFTPFFGASLTDKYGNEKSPYRSELFTVEQMELYAQKIARKHTLIAGHPSEQLLKRLAENENILLEVHQLLTENIKQNNRIVPAGEWLLDNFYLIEEQIYTGKKHLPKGYSKGLPQLAKGASEGLPRVYDIAVEIISHSDGRVDLQSLVSFIKAYQTVTTLKLGELWAVPIMLRLALLENLRRLGAQIALDIIDKNLADYWADEMTETAKKDPKSLVLVIADMARSNPPMESAFVAELTRRLLDKGAALTLPLSWVEQRLSENGLTCSELVHLENQKQAADQVSISNSISSLRFLNTTDWREFVEDTSIVEQILSSGSDDVYKKMDFHTRDAYRHVVEKAAKNSSLSEEEVANMVVQLAGSNLSAGQAFSRTSHVGYYLVGKGFAQVEKNIQPKISAGDSLKKIFNKAPVFYYLFAIALVTFLLSWMLVNIARAEGVQGWKIIVLFIICLLATSQFSITIINWLSTLIARPSLLPRMDFSKGIPEENRCLVVVPTILTNADEVDHLIEGLEVRFLANRDERLHFALLTDFNDSALETQPGDEALLELAKNKIIDLNRRYGRKVNDTFFLFHRPRKWNEREKVWMGYERKRGKLSALNALLKKNETKNFSLIVGDEAIFPQIKYVITLDTDTLLPRDAAWKMIGTMAHPLNHALYSEKQQRVVDGYTILQPRVSNSQPHTESSVFAKINSNEPGTDPYTRAISDVYQDLFGEGSFIGKGIYDIDAFEKSLNGRFPDNRILSHDLVEGCYARCGLVSDVQLYEAYPQNYNADIKRRHRWIRGDWQIARWLFPHVPAPDKRFKRNPLSALSRWKIFDNLRRSLVPLSFVLLLLFGWLLSPAAWFWTFTVLGIITSSSIITFVWELWRKPTDILLFQHLVFSLKTGMINFIHHLLNFIFLPYEALIYIDAILLTGWRMFISGRKLLEWNPSINVINIVPKTLPAAYLSMWTEPVFALGILCYLMHYSSIALIIQIPVLMIWMLAPAFAWLLSHPGRQKKYNISNQQTLMLQKLSRKIWAFFEDFVTRQDNWLPPDNYQEHPAGVIAHRTSPTNIGLALLANLTAYDFGYISPGCLIERTAHTLNSIKLLEKYRGHLFNWYDTISLIPLSPRYISTVDSGNFVGHLITLKQALFSLPEDKIFSPKIFDGLSDTAAILLAKEEKQIVIRQFQKELEDIRLTAPSTLQDAKRGMNKLQLSFNNILSAFSAHEEQDNETFRWVEKLGSQINEINNDLGMLAPWILLTPPSEALSEIQALLSYIPTLTELAAVPAVLLPGVRVYYSPGNSSEENEWLDAFVTGIITAGKRARERILLIEDLTRLCVELSNVDYDFLYDRSQHLLTIGYNAEEHRKDNSYYDLLASEARLSTFVAIAQGKLPQESWFALGRQLTNVGATPILISWSGSMFEYLMPMLVMPSYENTILDQTHKAVVAKQIDYGKKRGVPWGISESGYNMVDAGLNYQYRAFGVPGLGLKRGLGEDLVISPYSTVMALMVMPEEACDNLELLSKEGFEGEYGFYEAIDYTASRLPRGKTNVVIRSFMAHHQGMSLLSLSYLLLDQPMQKRFEAEVQFQSALLLLQERIPRVSTFYSPSVHTTDSSTMAIDVNENPIRVINTPHTPLPEVQLLSNGSYHVMVTNAGGGYSKWKDIAVTRWREDVTCDNWGTFCFIKDLDSNTVWSSAHQPTLQEAASYEAVFSQGRAEFRRQDNSIETHTEIVVSPEDDVELRRIHLTNRSRKKRYLEITSYAEVVLTSPAADSAHTAFSNLFVETEIIDQRNAILCNRRPRSVEEHTPSMFHLMKVHNAKVEAVSYETDRAKFIGRGNTIHHPAVMQEDASLSNTQGPVLDPVIAIQYRIIIEPQQTAIVDMVIGIAETRPVCNSLVEKYQDKHLTDRGFELSWTHSQVVLRQINAVEPDAQLYGRLAASVIYANPSLRADANVIMRNHRGQSGLWSYSISGDLPIVLLQIEDGANIELVKQMIQAHAYWRLKGLMVDLVIWNEDHGGYRQTLQNQILGLVVPAAGAEMKEQPGGIFIRSADQISNEDRILFQTVARIIISDTYGTLEEQIGRRDKMKTPIPYFSPSKFYPSLPIANAAPGDLQFFNGFGGFSNNGKEYVITTTALKATPAPWINVLANPGFGTIISESGQSYTWIENAHEFRLTPWNNDAVTDLAGEVFYIRDEESGKFWSPSPLQSKGKSSYLTRHGFGYSIFEHIEDGIHSEMTVFVDLEAPVKFIVLKLHNKSGRSRRLSVTGYIEWVLGDLRPKSQMHVVTEMNMEHSAILARNSYNTELQNKTAFFEVDDTVSSFTADRTEFIGRNGLLSNPEAMNKAKLSGKCGAGLDPCAAIQSVFDLPDDGEQEIIFKLGAGNDFNHAIDLIKQFKTAETVYKALSNVQAYWQKTLGVIQITTPDAALNILANGWLNYQALACRIWARSGFYQSGGAFGFRDQLQDVLSLLHNKPGIVREQIILNASRQFKEGDVQHWWHPPVGRGVRTTCSDDYLWLPFVTARYVLHTGDAELLNEKINFLEGRLLNVGEESSYDLPVPSDQFASLYNHCIKAIEHGLKFGEHGLPLMGSGDWNDGMDKVGEHGKGESVWLAFFLYDVLMRFSEVALLKGDTAFNKKCIEQAKLLQKNIEKNAWDGEWYRRAYFDDGTPLGADSNDECKIDSIAQSWSVLSKAGDRQRINTAMQSAGKYLIKKDAGIIQLFDPPFDKSALNPGYIKGYVPGVRENGGQYTHAAIWLVMAYAALKDRQQTWQLLQMINPINLGRDAASIATYKVEPYVMAADVYAISTHKGRGGWTWYTGSAGWMYQLIIESFMGIKRTGNELSFDPCIPDEWNDCKMSYQFIDTTYQIIFTKDNYLKGMKVLVNDVTQESKTVLLVNDAGEHFVKVVLGDF